jgi:putative heme-binding domain-containing protein
MGKGPTDRLLNFRPSVRAGTGPSRAVPLQHLLPTFAPSERQPFNPEPKESELVKGGDWQAGKAIFFGEAKCSTCHVYGNEGGNLGPNLSHLNFVNAESVLQDVVAPSARINPDYPNFIIELKSGDTISGLVRNDGERLAVVEGADKITQVSRSDAKEIRPAKLSIMPEGYKEQLGEKKLKDLLTFLTTEEPKLKGKK